VEKLVYSISTASRRARVPRSPDGDVREGSLDGEIPLRYCDANARLLQFEQLNFLIRFACAEDQTDPRLFTRLAFALV